MSPSALLLGPHIDPPLSLIPPILGWQGLTVYQTTLRDPRRLSKDGIPDEEDQEGFRALSSGLWGIVHASMLISLGAPGTSFRGLLKVVMAI